MKGILRLAPSIRPQSSKSNWRKAEREELPAWARIDLTSLKWLAVVVPFLFLVAVHILLHTVLVNFHDPPGIVLVSIFVALGVGLFSFMIFGIVTRLQLYILDQNRLLSMTNEIATASAANLDLERLLQVSLDRVLELTGAAAGIIYATDPEVSSVLAASHSGFTPDLAAKLQKQDVGGGLTDGQSQEVGQVPTVDLFKDHDVSDLALRDGFRSGIAVLMDSNEPASAILGVAVKQGQPEVDRGLLSEVGNHLGLAIRNALLYRRANQRNHELAALLTVGRATITSIDLAEILDRALEAILDVTSAEVAEVWLRDGDDELVLERQRGVDTDAFRERTRFKWGEGLPGLAASRGTPVLVHDLEAEPRFLRQQVKRLGFKSFCALPLRHRFKVVGVLAVASRDREALRSQAERGLLEGIGERLAIAIENSRLQEQVLDQAVLEERERIARELHDGLAQVLGYINTQTMATKRLVISNKLQQAEDQLNSMEEATRRVYSDVREAIMGLGSSLSGGDGFAANLKQYLTGYSDLSGVSVSLELGDKAPVLPASIELQLMRIVQESLSNVRKHAQATQASITFDSFDEELIVKIEDNGRGFFPDQRMRTGWPHFGLRSMSERANAIGGALEVVSAPDEGAKVIVKLPLVGKVGKQ